MNIICKYCGKETGVFCIQFGTTYFPSCDWDDFCVPIVSDWIDTVNRSCPGSAFRLYFMDGPYYLLCHRDKHQILIRAVDDHDGSVRIEESVPFRKLQTQLLEIAKMLLTYRDKSDNCDSDFGLLQAGLKMLEQGNQRFRR